MNVPIILAASTTNLEGLRAADTSPSISIQAFGGPSLAYAQVELREV